MTVIYNPGSHKRTDHLKRACDILMVSGKKPSTACGWVRNIGRAGETHKLMTLRELREETADMFMTVFIGNGSTFISGGRLITPRGYRDI